MSLLIDLQGVLGAVCPRTYPRIAPQGTARPYVTFQGVGGRSLRFLDNSPADKRHTLVQVNAWADTALGVSALAQQIEDALCASTNLTATPVGEPLDLYEEDTQLYGALQQFSIHSTR